jgi:hypothetical protein
MTSKTLTLRLNESDSLVLQDLMTNLEEKTAAKTLNYAFHNFLDIQTKLSSSRNDVEDLQNEVVRLNTIIENARLSAFAFTDAISKEDLF